MSRSILPVLAVGLAVGLGAQAPAIAQRSVPEGETPKGVSRAQTKAARDIPWYMANDRARAATIALCRSDHSHDRDTDCANAETAENRLWAERASAAAGGASRANPPKPSEMLRSPGYWVENGLARVGALAACRNPVTNYLPEECAAARRGDVMARAARATEGR